MNISGIGYNQPAYNKVKQTKTENVSFEIKKGNSEDSVLDYYHGLCKKYPDITFRLNDMEDAIQKGRNTGYNNSLNQVGENYGAIGQCSISLDVKVIENMMNDPNYARGVNHWIEYIQNDYSLFEDESKQLGCSYTDVSIEDDNGRCFFSVGHYHLPFSTENELKEIWAQQDAGLTSEDIKKKFSENVDMFDHLMETFDKSQEKYKEMIRRYYDSDKLIDELDKRNNDVLRQKQAVEKYDKHVLTE